VGKKRKCLSVPRRSREGGETRLDRRCSRSKRGKEKSGVFRYFWGVARSNGGKTHHLSLSESSETITKEEDLKGREKDASNLFRIDVGDERNWGGIKLV